MLLWGGNTLKHFAPPPLVGHEGTACDSQELNYNKYT